MAAPFALTYTAAAAELPAWQSYTESATLTTTAFWTYATLDAEGRQTLVSGVEVQTAYGTEIVQLPITVDVTYSVGGPYTTAGGTGPTVVSVLGATGEITLGATSQVLPSTSAAAPEVTSAETSVVDSPATTSATSLPASNDVSSTAASSPTASAISSNASSSVSPSTSTSPSSTSAADSSTSTLSSLGSSSSSAPTAAAAQSTASHLSGGRIAGIVLGVLAFLLLLLLLLLCLLRRRRRQLKRDSSGRSHEWDFTPAANSTSNTRRRSSAATGGSRGGLWGLAGLVGIGGSSAEGSPSTGRGEKTEKYGDIGAVREVVEDGEGFEGMAMMDESASPASIFPTIRGRGAGGGGGYAVVDGGAAAAARSASGGARASGEQGGLLDPFGEREGEDEDGEFQGEERDYRTPEMPSGWAGAAAATGLLHGVGEDWSGTPSTQASPARADRPPRVYPSFRISGTSTPPDSPPPPIRRNRRGVPILSEFAWMRGRTDNLGGTASTNDSGSGSGGTGATRSSLGATTNSGSGSRSGGGSGLEPGGSDNRHSRGSRGTSMNDASPNVSELFYNTPRWLGTRQPSYSSLGSPGSQYPDAPPDTPLMYPLAVTNSDPMRNHHRSREVSHESTGTGAGSAREMRHRSSEGMLDRIAASFGNAFAGLGIRQGRSRETSHESEHSGGSRGPDRFTDTPPRITPRVASQPSTTGSPSLAPLRRSVTTATFGQTMLGIPGSSSSASSSDNEAHAKSYEAHDSFEQDFKPPKASEVGEAGAPKGENRRLTATSIGTLGQHIDSSHPTRSPSPSDVFSDGDVGATTLGSHSHSHSHSHSGSGSQSYSHGHFSSTENDPSSQGSDAHSRLGSGGAPPAYDRRRNTLGRQVTVSEADSGSGSGRSRSMRTTESSEGSSGQHSHAHSGSSGVPPPIPESETVRQGLKVW